MINVSIEINNVTRQKVILREHLLGKMSWAFEPFWANEKHRQIPGKESQVGRIQKQSFYFQVCGGIDVYVWWLDQIKRCPTLDGSMKMVVKLLLA